MAASRRASPGRQQNLREQVAAAAAGAFGAGQGLAVVPVLTRSCCAGGMLSVLEPRTSCTLLLLPSVALNAVSCAVVLLWAAGQRREPHRAQAPGDGALADCASVGWAHQAGGRRQQCKPGQQRRRVTAAFVNAATVLADRASLRSQREK